MTLGVPLQFYDSMKIILHFSANFLYAVSTNIYILQAFYPNIMHLYIHFNVHVPIIYDSSSFLQKFVAELHCKICISANFKWLCFHSHIIPKSAGLIDLALNVNGTGFPTHPYSIPNHMKHWHDIMVCDCACTATL